MFWRFQESQIVYFDTMNNLFLQYIRNKSLYSTYKGLIPFSKGIYALFLTYAQENRNPRNFFGVLCEKILELTLIEESEEINNKILALINNELIQYLDNSKKKIVMRFFCCQRAIHYIENDFALILKLLSVYFPQEMKQLNKGISQRLPDIWKLETINNYEVILPQDEAQIRTNGTQNSKAMDIKTQASVLFKFKELLILGQASPSDITSLIKFYKNVSPICRQHFLLQDLRNSYKTANAKVYPQVMRDILYILLKLNVMEQEPIPENELYLTPQLI